MYVNEIKADNQRIRNEFQKELMEIANDNSEFRLSVQKSIADLTLKIEQEFVRKNNE
jgi:SMC interacting uncharacterized protein involved in chromosome segregation